MANTRIGRTVSVAGSRRKATFSAWVKRTGLGESWIARFIIGFPDSRFAAGKGGTVLAVGRSGRGGRGL